VKPIKTCSLGGPALGMAVDVFDPAGTPIRDAPSSAKVAAASVANAAGVFGYGTDYLFGWTRHL